MSNFDTEWSVHLLTFRRNSLSWEQSALWLPSICLDTSEWPGDLLYKPETVYRIQWAVCFLHSKGTFHRFLRNWDSVVHKIHRRSPLFWILSIIQILYCYWRVLVLINAHCLYISSTPQIYILKKKKNGGWTPTLKVPIVPSLKLCEWGKSLNVLQ